MMLFLCVLEAYRVQEFEAEQKIMSMQAEVSVHSL